MQLFLLTALTMCAFAANSLLNRLAVEAGGIDPGSFAVLRVLSGAVLLSVLVRLSGRSLRMRGGRRLLGGGALALYMVGFSLAYLTLDAGLGALILFGVVQITMFAVSAWQGAGPTARQGAGAGIAFAGLAWVLWPGADWSADPVGALCMVAAGIGWAVYSILGRGERDALAGTAANFWVALPLVALVPVVAGGAISVAPLGVALAIVSGAVTSGMGYALWYRVLPQLAPALAATVQLSVPVLALGGGVVLLGEIASLQLAFGAAVVLGGIALALGGGARR